MGLVEIWAPEAVIVFFLALPLVRPFFKKLWPLDGLVWLPLIALGITIGIFPAYGFRPECLPILIFALVYNIANLSPLISSIASHPSDTFRDRGPLSAIFLLVLLGVVSVPMFVFSPRLYERPETEPVQVLAVTGFYNRTYSLRVYGSIQPDKPIIFFVPPEIGSTASIDHVCAELQRKNFTVVTYFHKGYSPMTYWRVFRSGASLASVNALGKALETERRTEIELLLPRLPALLGYSGSAHPPPVLLVGYGAGGSALAYMAGESGFMSNNKNILGVVSIEGRLYSSYLPESRAVPARSIRRGTISRQWNNIVNWLSTIKPQRVNRTGSLPLAGLPVLHLVSGAALDSSKGQKAYQAVDDCFRVSSGPVAFAAIEGAGALDYQDFPFTHPIYSFLLPGRKGSTQSNDPIGDTASIIGNFASLLLEQMETTEETAIQIPPRYGVHGRLYVETKGLPTFR